MQATLNLPNGDLTRNASFSFRISILPFQFECSYLVLLHISSVLEIIINPNSQSRPPLAHVGDIMENAILPHYNPAVPDLPIQGFRSHRLRSSSASERCFCRAREAFFGLS